ncbi:TRAP transporter small permease [Bosea rubneri]|uniref:TRAP transporter small permease protein n=1 Tax=Bosea rubneri TaxID=3075434 RepID=A0ABU3S4C4_9HYPH|nr:TRAP transporter small permease [Bosea sp. ZW T0_25]MDU0339602.1 TRAP transporter small permease [Bosea sp. ZW T0_25]
MTPDSSPAAPRSALARGVDIVDRLTLAVSSIGVALFSAVVVYVALGRYLLGTTPYWSEELPRSLLVWSVFIGLVPATVRASHLNAGLLPLLVRNERLRGKLETVARLLTALFFAILAYTGWQLTEAGLDSLTTALQIPNAVVYVALPIGAGLSAIVILLPLLKERAP